MHNLSKESIENKTHLPIKVMQFGGGNFLRAFVDWMIQELNQQTNFNGGVAIIKPTAHGDYENLRAQDGLFTVVLDGVKNGELIDERTLITCVQAVINPYTEWDLYLDLAKNPQLRFIVSNTTEAGIKFNEKDAFGHHPPHEFPAKLTLWLYKRFQHFGNDTTKGCIILPCELIENNGAALKKAVLQYAEYWNLREEFMNWIYKSNKFCSTLVDRIVSGYPSSRADQLKFELEYDDKLLVAGEYYHCWVIQADEAVQKELPFSKTNLNVEFVKDLKAYREMKVRILNGAHTSMVPVGYLAGLQFVNEAMANEEVGNFIQSLLLKEIAVTLNFPETVINKYVQDVLDRFHNPLIKHQLISISLNSTSKFVARLLPAFKAYYRSQRKLPKRIVFGLSALLRMYKGDFEGDKIELKDDENVLEFFDIHWKKYQNGSLKLNILVGILLSESGIWGEDLSLYEGLVHQVTENIISINTMGMKATLNKIENDN